MSFCDGTQSYYNVELDARVIETPIMPYIVRL